MATKRMSQRRVWKISAANADGSDERNCCVITTGSRSDDTFTMHWFQWDDAGKFQIIRYEKGSRMAQMYDGRRHGRKFLNMYRVKMADKYGTCPELELFAQARGCAVLVEAFSDNTVFEGRLP